MLVRDNAPGNHHPSFAVQLTNLHPDIQTRDPSVLSYAIGIESEGTEPWNTFFRTDHDVFFSTSRSFSDIGNELGKLIPFSWTACSDMPRDRQTKVALRCSDEEEMLLLQAKAQSLNLCARSIQDA